MALGKKITAALVDTGLVVGLIAAVGAVYNVETRMPRATIEPSTAKKKLTVEAGLAGTTTRWTTYELRTAPPKEKEKLILQFGGTPETEQCVQAGLDWLVRHQAEDGSWSSDCLLSPGTARSRCEPTNPCPEPGQNYVMAQTGLALLALQGAGNYDFNGTKYSQQVRRGLDWLIQRQGPDGALVGPLSVPSDSRDSYFMYEHAMASFALAEACAVRKALGGKEDQALWDAAVKAIGYIEAQQHTGGGWRYTTRKGEAGDTSVSGWAMLALKSAKEAELPVGQETLDRTRDFFKACETPDGQTGYLPGSGGGSDALTAVGMLTHLLLLKEPEAPLVSNAAGLLAGRAETYGNNVKAGNAEFYTLYNVTLAMYQAGGDPWERWNRNVRDAVVAGQSKGPGCKRGSWDPAHTHGGYAGGRIYSTALGTLMLEVYYRFAREGQGRRPGPRSSP